MNIILGFAALLFSLTAFSGEKVVKSVSLVKETIDFTLHCDAKTDRGYTKHICWDEDIAHAAKNFAEENGGDFVSYEIVQAPEGFEAGRFARSNLLKIRVAYLK